MSYPDTMKALRKIQNDYGDFTFKSAISYLYEAGSENFSDESVEKMKADIMKEDAAIRETGGTPFISGAYQCQIVDVAFEISKLPTFDVLAYLQDSVPIQVIGREISNAPERSAAILDAALGYIDEHTDPGDLYKVLTEHLGMTLDEIAGLGFDVDELITNEEQKESVLSSDRESGSVRGRLESKKAAHNVSSEQPSIRKVGEPAPKKDNLDGMIAPPSTDNYSR
ncbi:MAG: hypothetical protein IJ168_02125 [Eubacterium sp.]|nr:hypothetical protein [Eubacterium sp.]